MKLKYYYKVWLFTIVLSPLVLTIVLWFHSSAGLSDIFPVLPLVFFAVLIGGAFSLPALFLFKFLHRDMQKAETSAWNKKAIFSVVGVVLICITFYIIDREFFTIDDLDMISFPLIYCLCLVAGAFIYDVNVKVEE